MNDVSEEELASKTQYKVPSTQIALTSVLLGAQGT
jgi:hypothetical protein